MSTYASYFDPKVTKLAAKEHAERVRLELIQAGISRHGLHKSETAYLPSIIESNEHIGGVVYGQTKVGSVMLIATNERIIYLDRKPFMTIKDDISYNVVSGVRLTRGALFTSLTLHTRIHDFTINYVNQNCARNFEQYIAERCIENPTAFRPANGQYDQF